MIFNKYLVIGEDCIIANFFDLFQKFGQLLYSSKPARLKCVASYLLYYVLHRPMYEHVIELLAGAGEVTLIHNQYCVPLVVFYQVDLEVGACCHPPLATPHWTPYGPVRSR